MDFEGLEMMLTLIKIANVSFLQYNVPLKEIILHSRDNEEQQFALLSTNELILSFFVANNY